MYPKEEEQNIITSPNLLGDTRGREEERIGQKDTEGERVWAKRSSKKMLLRWVVAETFLKEL